SGGGGVVTANGVDRVSLSSVVVVETLPLFRDVAISDRQNLFLPTTKLTFMDRVKSAREKEIKRRMLLEIVDFIQSGSGKITEVVQEKLIRMVSVNIFWRLPPASHENTGMESGDPEEDDSYLEPSKIEE
ncbi:hypothetical protein IFM89_017017, partial [Coptis chinensis]